MKEMEESGMSSGGGVAGMTSTCVCVQVQRHKHQVLQQLGLLALWGANMCPPTSEGERGPEAPGRCWGGHV